MAVEHVVFVAGVIIGQGHDQGLSGHFARLSRLQQLMTHIFSPKDQMMDHISCFGASESLIMDHLTCWGMPKEEWAPGHASKRTSE